MNIKLLKRIAKTITQRPEQFDMEYWFRFDKDIPNCHTAACIAGWAVTLGTTKAKAKLMPFKAARLFVPVFGTKHINGFAVSRYDQSSASEGTIIEKAMFLLGINEAQANRLFYRDRWPQEYKDAFGEAVDGLAYLNMATAAKVASKRIAHFIKTDGEE